MSHLRRRRSVRLVLASLCTACVMVAASPAPSEAATLNLGFISYDVFIPGDSEFPGVNAINLFNFTGDPLAGGFALDPDFPSYTPVTFQNSSLRLVIDGVEQLIDLGNIGPGVLDPSPNLLFPETAIISSLMFSATLSTTTFTLQDGTSLFASSAMLFLTLLPALDSAFLPGVDFGLLTVEVSTEPPSTVPEPGALALSITGVFALAGRSNALRRRRKRQDLATNTLKLPTQVV